MHQQVKDKIHHYLASDIMMQSTHTKTVFPLYDLSKQGDCYSENATYYGKASPFMRPLSSLTKPITVPGYNDRKPFVPLHHIYHIARGNYTDQHIPEFSAYSSTEFIYEYEFVKRVFGYHLVYDSDVRIEQTLGFHLKEITLENRMQINDIGITTEKSIKNASGLYIPIKNMLNIYELLFRWHFWLWDQSLFTSGDIIEIKD